jgi:hypothetical protein
MARFSDGADSFSLSPGVTLAELSDVIDELGSHHKRAPLAVQVQFEEPILRMTAIARARRILYRELLARV